MARHGDILACGCWVGRAQRCEEARRLEDARDRARTEWLCSSRETNAEMAARYDQARAALQAHFDAQEVVGHTPIIPRHVALKPWQQVRRRNSDPTYWNTPEDR